MAKIGYLFLSRNLVSREEDLAWMKAFGCVDIIEEDGIQERFRPQWRRMLSHLKKDDEVVVSKLSNALRGIRELGVFLGLCKDCGIRLVSIHDEIDTKGDEKRDGGTMWDVEYIHPKYRVSKGIVEVPKMLYYSKHKTF